MWTVGGIIIIITIIIIMTIIYDSFAQTTDGVGWEKKSAERLAGMVFPGPDYLEAELTFSRILTSETIWLPMEPVTINTVGLKEFLFKTFLCPVSYSSPSKYSHKCQGRGTGGPYSNTSEPWIEGICDVTPTEHKSWQNTQRTPGNVTLHVMTSCHCGEVARVGFKAWLGRLTSLMSGHLWDAETSPTRQSLGRTEWEWKWRLFVQRSNAICQWGSVWADSPCVFKDGLYELGGVLYWSRIECHSQMDVSLGLDLWIYATISK